MEHFKTFENNKKTSELKGLTASPQHSVHCTNFISVVFFKIILLRKYPFQSCFRLTIWLPTWNIWRRSYDLRGHHINQHKTLNKVIWFYITVRNFGHDKERFNLFSISFLSAYSISFLSAYFFLFFLHIFQCQVMLILGLHFKEFQTICAYKDYAHRKV